jgi:glycosyltransferase involved in cell wall biosynthesis
MEEKKYKIVLAHPGRQHSFRVAKALKEKGWLYKYITTVYNKDDSLAMRIAKLFLNHDNWTRAKKRKCESLEDSDVKLFNEFWGYIILLLLRIDKTKKAYTWLNERVRDSFGRKVARYAIKHKVDAVICFDTNSKECFKILQKRAPQIKRILDNAHPARNYLYKVYNEKMVEAGKFAKTYEACGYIMNSKISDYFGEEIRQANYHIVASSFSEKALIYNNVKKFNIIKVPYGVDSKQFNFCDKNYKNPLNVLFVGEINQRKGIAQILEAAKQLSGKDFEFNLIGMGCEYRSYLYEDYKQYVNLLGRVSFEELIRNFKVNHIFIFPTMGEGFGLVILEAMAAGLPVIASYNCAGPDLIQNGYNGFLIEAGDTEALKEKILWFYNHSDKISEMSKNARSTALKYSWENYEKKLILGLTDKLIQKDE